MRGRDLLQAVNARMRQVISAPRLHVGRGPARPGRGVSRSRHRLRRRQSRSSSWGREQRRVGRLGICTKRQRRDAGGKNQNDRSEADHGVPSKEPVSEQLASLRNCCSSLNSDTLSSRLLMPVGGGGVRKHRHRRVRQSIAPGVGRSKWLGATATHVNRWMLSIIAGKT
jgi:hypothetical protein